MSALALVTFIEIYDPEEVPASGNISGAIQHRFQNSEPTSSGITFNGATFNFLSFLYQGATRSKDGNNLESTLILANESNDREGSIGTNKLSMSYAAEAVDNGWSVRVSTCEMTDLTFSSVKTTIVVDTWKIASMGYDNTSIEILLTSTIDAVKGNIGRFLTSSLVGHLPVTASMRTR